MSLTDIIDCADHSDQTVGKFRLSFTLIPDALTATNFAVSSLNWRSINYGPAQIDDIPDDKRGIYAFVLRHENPLFPPNGYIMYIGIAGQRSARTLRARYRDYLDANKVKKRVHIARMIGRWHAVLKFYFAPVDDVVTTQELEALEKQLNGAFMPPFALGDLEATVKAARKAFP